MADLLGILGFISELIIAGAGFAITIFTLQKDPKSTPHRLLAFSTALIGFYGASIFIYDVTGIAELVKFFLRLGIFTLFLGVIFLFFTFQVIVHTKEWLKPKRNTWPFIIGVVIYAIVFYAWDGAVVILRTTPVVDTQVAISMIAILGISLLLLLLVTMNNLYRFGIKPSEGIKRRKMEIAFIGFSICLVALFVNVASNLVDVGGLLDIAFFLILACGMTVIAYGFIGPTRN